METEPTYPPIVDRGIQIRFRSIAQWIEGAAVVSDLYSEHILVRGQRDIELVEAFLMSVVHDVEPQLFKYQIDTEDELSRPVLPLADVFHSRGYPLQFAWIGLHL